MYAHGYRSDLRRQPMDGWDDNMMQPRERIEDMPRYKIANNPFYFESVFKLLEREGEVASNAWTFIKTMTTNPHLYKRILALDLDPEFEWGRIFEDSSIYKMLYTLQIVEALLEEEETAGEGENDEAMDEELRMKENWIQRFLQVGGFQQILNLFHKSLELLSQKQVDALSKFEKNFLEYMLKLIRIFILSAFSANDQSVFEVFTLVKKSSVKESEVP